jgi:hypothetical protein
MKRRTFLSLSLIPLAGCGEDFPEPAAIIEPEKPDSLLVFCFDPQFPYLRSDSAGLWRMFTGTIQNFLEKRPPTARVMLVELATEKKVVWSGNRAEFAETFHSPADLRSRISSSHISSPRDALARTLHHVSRLEGVKDGKVPVFIFVLSQMLSDGADDKLIAEMKAFRPKTLKLIGPPDDVHDEIDRIYEQAGYGVGPWTRADDEPYDFTNG